MRLIFLLFCHVVTAAADTSTASSPAVFKQNSGVKIVGGNETRITEYPFQVSVMRSETHECGGSIVSAKLILTSATCTGNRDDPSIMTVRVGSTLRSSGGRVVAVNQIMKHPKFDGTEYDVALLSLDQTLEFTPEVQPIGIVEVGEKVQVGDTVVVSGWGVLRNYYDKPVLPMTLNAVEVPVLSKRTCEEAYSDFLLKMSDRLICAGSQEMGMCKGDEGGPVVKVVNGKKVQVGIASWDFICGLYKFPGIYTSLSDLAINVFITEHVKSTPST